MTIQTKVVMAQLNFMVGDIQGNTQKILDTAVATEQAQGKAILVFSELCITGYPPEDLLLRPAFIDEVEISLNKLSRELPPELGVVVGHPARVDQKLANAASLIHEGAVKCTYHKQCLPNYGVFDEKRYFYPGNSSCLFDWFGMKIGLTICEDVWCKGPIEDAARAGADWVININGSPFHMGRVAERALVVGEKAKANGVPIVYVNQIGGQDELVFDGASFIVDHKGEVVQRLKQFEEDVQAAMFLDKTPQKVPESLTDDADFEHSVYQALVLGVRDYVNKNRFKGAVIGLSGGIDSALTLAIAVDALGVERVQAVMMPSRYTSDMSIEDAQAEARALGVRYHVVPIEPMFKTFSEQLEPLFTGLPMDATEENIQARCRGVLLMAISNKFGGIVLTTGNKSEMAVGYATLYGDMAGGYAAIKDVPKTLVYRLAQYRNSVAAVIPQSVIDRPPSAELAPDQVDEDTLPPYDVLDPILEYYVEKDYSPRDIVNAGFQAQVVERIVAMVDRNEYKRRQAPPGVRITPKAFGRDRRYPITSGYTPT